MKKGEITELGWFLDGQSGYALGEGDAVTTFTNVTMSSTYFDMTVEEIIPYAVGTLASYCASCNLCITIFPEFKVVLISQPSSRN